MRPACIQVGIVLPGEVGEVSSLQLTLSYEQKRLVIEQFRLIPNNVLQVPLRMYLTLGCGVTDSKQFVSDLDLDFQVFAGADPTEDPSRIRTILYPILFSKFFTKNIEG